MLFRTAIPLLVARLIAACATPRTAPAPIPRDNRWVSDLVDRPKGDRDRFCVESALNISMAIMDFVEAGFSDETIKSKLLQGTSPGPVRTMRENDFRVWQSSRSFATVAGQRLAACLSEGGHQVTGGSRIARCFYATEPVTVFWLDKSYGRALPDSMARVKQRYPDLDRSENLQALAEAVFASNLDEQTFERRQQIFSRCLRASS